MKIKSFFILIFCLAIIFLMLMGVIAMNNPEMKYGGVRFYPNKIFEISLYMFASLAALCISLLPIFVVRKLKRAP